MIHKRSTALERSVKYFTRGLNPVRERQPQISSDADQDVHVEFWFVGMNRNLSVHHLLEHINKDIKRR